MTMSCRLCLSPEAKISIFEGSNLLSNRIWNCCQLQVMVNDTLPNKICEICETKLESFENFKLVCVQTDQILKQKMDNRVQIKIEDDYMEYNMISTPDILHTTIEQDLCENVENDHMLNSNISLMKIYKNFKANSSLGTFEMIKCSEIKQDIDENKGIAGVKKFECNECGKILFNRFKLLKHKKIHLASKSNENLELAKSTEYCVEKNTLTSVGIDKVINLDVDKPECSKCGKLFLSQRFLTLHEMSHFIGDAQQSTESDNCNSENVIKRQSLTRSDNLNEFSKAVGESDYEMPPITEFWKCQRCEKILGAKRGLVQHYRRVHSVSVKIKSDNKVVEVSLVEKTKRNGDMDLLSGENTEALTCPTCKKSFKNKHTFKEHVKYVHLKERTIPCQICGALFKTQSYVKKHIRNSHLGESAVQCNTCGKILKTSTSYKQHMKVHSNEIYYTCDYCSKGFKHKNSLQAHIMGHMGQKPHRCMICFRSFLLKQTLRSHILQHTGENPFGCELCPRRFKQRCNLKSHMRHFHKKA